MKITLKNFQAIGSTVIEAEGLTVITGRSNVGKTALVRAVAAAVFGLPGDYYIRDGEHSCGVALEGPDIKLIWRKTKTPTPTRQTVLQVGERVHSKLGKDHSQLTEELGFKELITQYSRIRPQFAMQHDPIFLLGENETAVAEVFKLLGRTDIVTRAQQAAKKDLRQAQGELDIRIEDRRKNSDELDKFDYVPRMRTAYRQLEEILEVGWDKSHKLGWGASLLKKLQTLNPVEIPDVPVITGDELIRPSQKLIQLRDLGVRQRISEVPIISTVDTKALSKAHALELLIKEDLFEKTMLKETDGFLEDLAKQRSDLEREFGVCPTCERAF